MKFLVAIIIFIVALNVVNGAIEIISTKSKKVTQGGKTRLACDYSGKNLFPGDSFLTDECSEITCSEKFETREATCGIFDVNGCRLEPDFSLKYPDCCGKICKNKVKSNKRRPSRSNEDDILKTIDEKLA